MLIPDFVTLPIVAPGAPRILVSISGTGSVPCGPADPCGPAACRLGLRRGCSTGGGSEDSGPSTGLFWGAKDSSKLVFRVGESQRHGDTEVRETARVQVAELSSPGARARGLPGRDSVRRAGDFGAQPAATTPRRSRGQLRPPRLSHRLGGRRQSPQTGCLSVLEAFKQVHTVQTHLKG